MSKDTNNQRLINVVNHLNEEYTLSILNSEINTSIHSNYQKMYIDALRSNNRNLKREYDDLVRNCFEKVRVFDKETALNILNEVSKFESVKGGGQFANINYEDEKILVNSPDLVKSIFERIFTPEIDNKIFNYFFCEYAPLTCYIHKIKPKEELNESEETKMNYSIHWHCDAGPEKHLKLLVHLCDMREHDGGTYFVDRETTAKLKDIGYVHGGHKTRTFNIEPLCEYYNIKYDPIMLKTDIGEAVIFNPGQLLHRGVRATNITRIYISVLLIPFVSNWKTFLDRHINFVINNINSSFPKLMSP